MDIGIHCLQANRRPRKRSWYSRILQIRQHLISEATARLDRRIRGMNPRRLLPWPVAVDRIKSASHDAVWKVFDAGR